MPIDGTQPPLQFSFPPTDSLIQGLRQVPLSMIQLCHASTHGTQGDLPCSRLPDLAQRPGLRRCQLPRCGLVEHDLNRQFQTKCQRAIRLQVSHEIANLDFHEGVTFKRDDAQLAGHLRRANVAMQKTQPGMDIRQAVAAFDEAEAESLAVVETVDRGRVIGLLTEAHALRRYAEESDKHRRDMVGEM